jgi:predicted enzyme related to lactoylglutathione lyase
MSTDSAVPDGQNKQPEPESFRARTLSVSLTVKDLDKSLVWYQDVVGFTVDQKYEREGKLRAVALKAGEVRVLIGQDDGDKGWDRVKGEGFSLLITTDQNVDEFANRIKERGGTLESEPADMPSGGRIFRLQDPDGFKLAISSPIRP